MPTRIEVDVPDGASGEWRVETFEVSEKDADFQNVRATFSFSDRGRYIEAGTYKRLMRGRTLVMSNTPAEIGDHMYFINYARRCDRVLINGLGLGVCLKGVLDSDVVREVTVVEKSCDVLNLVGPTFQPDARVMLVHGGALTWKPAPRTRYDAVWHDIWDHITADNLPEMERLHRRYGKRSEWQGSWCHEQCLDAR